MPFFMAEGDITQMRTDAVVNAANSNLWMGGGVCGAIFRAAGAERLQEACRGLSPVQTGRAVLTPGFSLSAKYIIHAVGPVYSEWSAEESRRLLYSAYAESLRLAWENRCRSISFPLISAGIYGYPKEEAQKTAVSAIRDFLREHEMKINLVFLDSSFCSVRKELLEKTEACLFNSCRESEAEVCCYSAALPSGLQEELSEAEESFSAALLRLIDEKGRTDSEIYKRANLDRRLFSKIRNGGEDYHPRKMTVLALAVALELSLPETRQLLEKAGYALSPSRKSDIIIRYFVEQGQYDIYEINEVLFHYKQPLLGG